MRPISETPTVAWHEWLAPALTEEVRLRALRAWYQGAPPRPILLEGALIPERFAALAAALDALPHWETVRALVDAEGTVRDVDEPAWDGASSAERWSRQQIARSKPLLFQEVPLAPEHRATLASFFLHFIVGTPFREWISAITGVRIAREATCEIARYAPGDFIVPHGDTHDARLIGVNLYLGPWRAGWGGRLGYVDEHERVSVVDPVENSMSLFSVRVGCRHWVEPWTGPGLGRRTISLSYRPAP